MNFYTNQVQLLNVLLAIISQLQWPSPVHSSFQFSSAMKLVVPVLLTLALVAVTSAKRSYFDDTEDSSEEFSYVASPRFSARRNTGGAPTLTAPLTSNRRSPPQVIPLADSDEEAEESKEGDSKSAAASEEDSSSKEKREDSNEDESKEEDSTEGDSEEEEGLSDEDEYDDDEKELEELKKPPTTTSTTTTTTTTTTTPKPRKVARKKVPVPTAPRAAEPEVNSPRPIKAFVPDNRVEPIKPLALPRPIPNAGRMGIFIRPRPAPQKPTSKAPEEAAGAALSEEQDEVVFTPSRSRNGNRRRSKSSSSRRKSESRSQKEQAIQVLKPVKVSVPQEDSSALAEAQPEQKIVVLKPIKVDVVDRAEYEALPRRSTSLSSHSSSKRKRTRHSNTY
jgi:hypothetical protein